METIHDKLKENFCIPNKPRLSTHTIPVLSREHFLCGETTQNKVGHQWKVRLRNALSLHV